MKTNDLINKHLTEERAAAKALRVFYIVAAIVMAAGIILLIYYKAWRDLGWACAVLNFTIGAACHEGQIVDLCTCVLDNTTDDLDTNLENAKKEEIE